jgi:hypothetical protein
LTAAQLNGLTTANFDAVGLTRLTASQVAGLNSTAIGNLTTTQVATLTTSQVGALTTTEIGVETSRHLANSGHTPLRRSVIPERRGPETTRRLAAGRSSLASADAARRFYEPTARTLFQVLASLVVTSVVPAPAICR